MVNDVLSTQITTVEVTFQVAGEGGPPPRREQSPWLGEMFWLRFGGRLTLCVSTPAAV